MAKAIQKEMKKAQKAQNFAKRGVENMRNNMKADLEMTVIKQKTIIDFNSKPDPADSSKNKQLESLKTVKFKVDGAVAEEPTQ